MEKYYWVRIFDYNYERDDYLKGSIIYEDYFKDVERESLKNDLLNLYKNLKFAKPRKKDGIYCILMDSSQFFYERFKVNIGCLCFNCLSKLKGRDMDFPNILLDDIKYYFCDYECKRNYYKKSDKLYNEGEFQNKEKGMLDNKEIFGYIYEIYNRNENTYYIGQTRYYPFFRWQEHIKSGSKGSIEDLTFRVISSLVSTKDEIIDAKSLNELESYYIKMYECDSKNVINITKPKFNKSEWLEIYNNKLKIKDII